MNSNGLIGKTVRIIKEKVRASRRELMMHKGVWSAGEILAEVVSYSPSLNNYKLKFWNGVTLGFMPVRFELATSSKLIQHKHPLTTMFMPDSKS